VSLRGVSLPAGRQGTNDEAPTASRDPDRHRDNPPVNRAKPLNELAVKHKGIASSAVASSQ
jgi:hypothetical protein